MNEHHPYQLTLILKSSAGVTKVRLAVNRESLEKDVSTAALLRLHETCHDGLPVIAPDDFRDPQNGALPERSRMEVAEES